MTNSSEYSREHPFKREWSGQTGRLRSLGPALSYHDQEEYLCRYSFLDGPGSH
jgi:hypothetical protein